MHVNLSILLFSTDSFIFCWVKERGTSHLEHLEEYLHYFHWVILLAFAST